MLFVCIAVLLNLALLFREARRQDRFLQNIIGEFPEIACVIDHGGRFKRWNSSLEAALGYTAQEIAQITVLDTIAKEQRERLQRTITTVVSVGMAEVESVLMSKDGTRIPCLFTGIRVVVGNRPCVLGIVVDLRNLRQAEEGLRASEEQYRSLVASIPEIVWRADAEGNVSFVGPRVEAVLGFGISSGWRALRSRAAAILSGQTCNRPDSNSCRACLFYFFLLWRASALSNPALINRMTHTSATATRRMCPTKQGIVPRQDRRVACGLLRCHYRRSAHQSDGDFE